MNEGHSYPHSLLTVIAYKESYFGGGTGEIRLRSLACSGYEASLLECRHTATTGSCNHNRDAGVRCLRGGKK